jgi:hypothetical protein
MEPPGVAVKHGFVDDFDGGESLAREIIVEGQWLFTLWEGCLSQSRCDTVRSEMLLFKWFCVDVSLLRVFASDSFHYDFGAP